jgi:hypothetical protein
MYPYACFKPPRTCVRRASGFVLTLNWVNQEQTGVLEDLSKRDRHLLYCVFVREMDWESTAHTFQISAREKPKTGIRR